MKQFIISAVLVMATISADAQCDKDVVLTSSATEYLDESGIVQKTVDEKTTIRITKTSITISPGNDRTMKGAIDKYTCSWKTPFKDGVTSFLTVIQDGDKAVDAKIKIEGKEGKVAFTATFEENGSKTIRVWADKFE